MEFRSYDMVEGETVRKPSLGACIYCGNRDRPRSSEHVIPFALGGNTVVLEDACCCECQRIIQRYEQQVLRDQMGVFRTRIDSPSRNRKARPKEQLLRFIEVDRKMTPLRDLGTRAFPIEEAPLSFSVWELAPPRVLGENSSEEAHVGRPWVSISKSQSQHRLAIKLARQVADEVGAEHVAVKVDSVNRENFLRFIAKTAHALAAFEYGLSAFRWLTSDIVCGINDDIAEYVGCDYLESRTDKDNPDSILSVNMGLVRGGGPADGCTAVRIRLYPFLGTPAHIVIVGAPAD